MQFCLNYKQWLGPRDEVELKEGLAAALEENGFVGLVGLKAVTDAPNPSYQLDIRFGRTCFGNLEAVQQAAKDYLDSAVPCLEYTLTALY